jgi:glycosyltransferase involved in cell wall biosynthesis
MGMNYWCWREKRDNAALRILILTRNFPPRSCGVGDYACRMAEVLSAAGDFVDVLTEPAGATRNFPFGLSELPLRGWRDLKPVLRKIADIAPHRVQLEYSGYAWGRWGVAWWLNALLFALRRRKITVNIGLHETAIRMRQHPMQIPVALAQWVHIALMMAAAETVELNMPSRVALLGRVFPWWRAKLRYRPNSSTIPVTAATEAEREAMRRQRGVASGEAVVATFGMFHTAKHYEALIGAMARLARTRKVRLWMLGDVAMAVPEYLAQLKRMTRECGIEEHVWWPGRMEAAELSRALQSADVFVLPQPDGHLTRSSAFMAAAAHGLPVVAVRNPEGRDQAEFAHEENVWLVTRSAPEEIAAALAALLADPAAAGRMGGALRRLYAERFDWSATVAGRPAAGSTSARSGSPGGSTGHEDAVTAAHAGGVKL